MNKDLIIEKQRELIAEYERLVNLCNAPQYHEIIRAKETKKNTVNVLIAELASLESSQKEPAEVSEVIPSDVVSKMQHEFQPKTTTSFEQGMYSGYAFGLQDGFKYAKSLPQSQKTDQCDLEACYESFIRSNHLSREWEKHYESWHNGQSISQKTESC